jgi:glycosyltransferase involved in cell wall biosynthesis
MRVSKWQRVSVLAAHARLLIREHAIDVVSAQDPFEHGLAALRAVKGTKAKLHVQIHTDFLSPWFTRGSSPFSLPVLLNRARQRMARKVLSHADGIRVVSKRIKDSLMAQYGERMQNAAVIPINVPGEVPPVVPLPAHSFTFALICVGRLEPEKRIEDIFAALAQLKVAYPMLGLLVAGEGRERPRLERMANRLGLQDRVLFLGDRPDAWGLMRSAQGFIQASAYEGYGRTLIEAALARLPIITTDVGIVGDVFKQREHALVSRPGDPAQLASHIRWMLEDNQMRAELAVGAEAAARAHLETAHAAPADIINDMARLV